MAKNPSSGKENNVAETGQDELVEDVDEREDTIPYRYSITAYGADYPVDGLVKRLTSGDIDIPTFDPEVRPDETVEGFQRQFIWTKPQCDRFIESLLLGLPVPGIFLVKLRDGRLLVLDGQQRLRTLEAFYRGVLRGREFRLGNVQDNYRNLVYATLDVEDRRRLDDSIIHATIVRQDEPVGDQSSIYLIFERLNTGGTTLHPQEIRVALYRGGLVRLLRDLNEYKTWRRLYGKKSSRLKDQELILRFFALRFWSSEYKRPMKDFLNRYLAGNWNFEMQSQDELQRSFEETTETVFSSLGERAFRLKTAVNAAVLDSIMVAVARRLSSHGPVTDQESLRVAYDCLLKSEAYLSTVVKATADEESVRQRLQLANKAMADAQ